jgi:hypothetical protein
LRTVRESGNKKTKTNTKTNTKTKKAPIQIPPKLNHLRLRYSHANSSSSFSSSSSSNKKGLYHPTPILKKKTKPISPSGNGWNLLTQELKKPSPKRISVRKYNESMTFIPPKIETRNTKPKLRFRPTTEKENRNALQLELNQPFQKVNPKGPLGSKI